MLLCIGKGVNGPTMVRPYDIFADNIGYLYKNVYKIITEAPLFRGGAAYIYEYEYS